MKRRSLDALFSLGFFIAAALLVAVGYILSANASETQALIRHQLAAQRIAFPPKDMLTSRELARPCVAENAGKWVRTPAQARCYADDFLGVRIDALVKQGTPKDQLFRGDTQRGLLLTAAVFEENSDRSRDLGNVFYVFAALLALLAVASMMHRAFVAEDTLAADGGNQRRPTRVPGTGWTNAVQRRLLRRRQRVDHSPSRG